ncbi:MAG: PhoH family protein [Gammaproteobacteria bacterium]|nr:MAG: PhoH family protein [Gammaproteobacteria bacterium]
MSIAHLPDTPLSLDIVLELADNQCLARICGQFDEHLRQIERRLGVEINNRGTRFKVIGEADFARQAVSVLKRLYDASEHDELSPEQVHLYIQGVIADDLDADEAPTSLQTVQTQHGKVRPRSRNQHTYVENIRSHDINFGIGPAGTGKTYLAVSCAVEALEREQVSRLLLVRPAVEAGERLGFLPGNLSQKIDPYLRPLYDALYEMMGFERISRLIERNIIEIAPLAYMRGRTLNEAFIILDEAQNTTNEQMKMFLTRIGFGSTTVITGDVTQVDLPRDKISGLRHVIDILHKVDGISFTFFKARDVVRHPLVQNIVTAYEEYEHNDRSDD